jgi:hypothetical protein
LAIPELGGTFPFSQSVLSVPNDGDFYLADASVYKLIRVGKNSTLRIPEGNVYTKTLIVEDEATLNGNHLGAKLWIGEEATIGKDVNVVGGLSIISEGDIAIGKRFCGASTADQAQTKAELEKRTRDELDNCGCHVPTRADCYCST